MMEEKQGTLRSVADNGITGTITEKTTGANYEFVDVRFPERKILIGEDVIFISVATPSGKVVVVDVKKPNMN
jgi:hypothetical protein